MTIKDEILRISEGEPRYITEMAQKELKKVLPMIKKGEYERAAEEYFAQGGKRAGVTKTVNSYIKKNPGSEEMMKKFANAISNVAEKKGMTTARKKSQTTKTGKTKTGETVEAGGQSGTQRKKAMMKRIQKEAEKSKDELSVLQRASNDKRIQEIAQDVIKDLQEAPVSKGDRKDIQTLKTYLKTGEGKDKAINIMKDIVTSGIQNLEMLYRSAEQGKSPSEEDVEKLEKRYQTIEKRKKEQE